MMPHHKALRHMTYTYSVTDEVVPFIHSNCGGLQPIMLTGASLGALHAANIFFRSPNLFAGTIPMSGYYDLKSYTKGYYDENVYFNSPVDYLSNLSDENLLNQMRHGKRIIIATGQGEYEAPQGSINLSNILRSKGIPHELEIWGHDMPHDWPTWRKMLPYFISKL
jgi:esterase/lipase superfamily enzyme